MRFGSLRAIHGRLGFDAESHVTQRCAGAPAFVGDVQPRNPGPAIAHRPVSERVRLSSRRSPSCIRRQQSEGQSTWATASGARRREVPLHSGVRERGMAATAALCRRCDPGSPRCRRYRLVGFGVCFNSEKCTLVYLSAYTPLFRQGGRNLVIFGV